MSSIASLISKFRGCLIGSHVGDCLGFPYEGEYPISKSVLSKYFTKLLDAEGKSTQVLPYTDDTAMTLSLGKSLAENKGFNALDMSKRFVEEYFKQPRRGYGEHVVDVFRALAETNYQNVFEPAKHQFRGTGSYGNGAAMRIAPAALFCYNKKNQMLETVKNCSSITHTHPNGYNGAILQCLAIDQALRISSTDAINPVQFVNNLLERMEAIEEPLTNARGVKEDMPFCSKLKKMKDIFENSKHMSIGAVVDSLGNSVSAQGSVPTAIYSFLKSFEPLDDFESDNPFIRAMFFSISLGGDTDTIAAMTGSIAGAYHGDEMIPKVLQEKCESLNQSKTLSEELYAFCCGN